MKDDGMNASTYDETKFIFSQSAMKQSIRNEKRVSSVGYDL